MTAREQIEQQARREGRQLAPELTRAIDAAERDIAAIEDDSRWSTGEKQRRVAEVTARVKATVAALRDAAIKAEPKHLDEREGQLRASLLPAALPKPPQQRPETRRQWG